MSGNLISLLNFLRRRGRQGGSELFSLVSRGRVCGNGSALQQERFRQDIKKYFFTWMEYFFTSGQTLKQAFWKGGQCPKPVSV